MTFREFISCQLDPDDLIRGASPTDGKSGYVPWPIGLHPNLGMNIVKAVPPATNELLCYCNVREWCSYGTEERKKALNNVYTKDFVTFEGRSDPATRNDHGRVMKAGDYLSSMARHKFVISPRGNGEDAHRTYEAIICRAIPIIQRNERIMEKYRGLPVLITENDYKDITEELLNRKYREMLYTEYDFDRLRESYWEEQYPRIKSNSRFWQIKHGTLENTEETDKLFRYVKGLGKDIVVTTAVTNGCIEMASNWFEGIKRSGLEDRAFVAGFDEKIIAQLGEKEIPCVYWKSAMYEPKDEPISGFKEGWRGLNMAKLDLMHTIIRGKQTLLYSDSDVVFLRSPIEEFSQALKDKDIIFQSGAKTDKTTDSVCMGFLCAKKTDNTIRLFDAAVSEDEKEDVKPLNEEFGDGTCDRALVHYRLTKKYFRKMKDKIRILDPYLYPNGWIICESPEFDIKKARVLRFNRGNGKAYKINKMKEQGVWYI